MQNQLSNQEIINRLANAIRKTIKEIEPNTQIKDEKIKGILIMQFPEDHAETTKIITTAVGKICFTHALENLKRLYDEGTAEANKIAT